METKTCKRDDCDKPLHAGGECQPHYRQTKRRERGLRKPGPRADPTKAGSRYNPAGVRSASEIKSIDSAKIDLLPEKQQNNRDKTHCSRGHEYSGASVRVLASGGRKCRICEMINFRSAKYGVTEEKFADMLEIQDECCAICKRSFLELVPHVDHDHTSGEIRALLCRDCNLGLGRFLDRPEWLRAAADYLERFTS